MQDKKSLKTRNILLQLADYLKVKGIQGVASKLGENPNKLYAWVKNDRVGDTGSILGKYPEISKEWLETGEGEMLIKPAGYPHGIDKFHKFSEQLPTVAGGDDPALTPNPEHMTLEQKLQWLGFGTKDIRQIQEWTKLTEEEQDEELKRLCMQNIEKGRY